MTEMINLTISSRYLSKFIDFNDFVNNKRVERNSQTISLPSELYHHINVKENRSKFLASIVKKYVILLNNLDDKEIFSSLDEFIRFFIRLDYLIFVNDLKCEFNSSNLNDKDKNGLVNEIENGVEFLREYDNGKLIKQNEIRGMKK